MRPINFNPKKDISDLSGKVIFVTGGKYELAIHINSTLNFCVGTAGLGKGSVVLLAQHNPAHIYFSGRNAKSASSVIEAARKITPNAKVTFVQADLSSLSSVQTAARDFVAKSKRLDILLCNAGIMAQPPALSADGYEIQFATNHLEHALLIKLLLPTMLRTAQIPGSDVRVISNTSLAAKGARGIKFDTLKTTQDGVLGPWLRYANSKLANILYAKELVKRYPDITSLSIHPGVIATTLITDLGFVNRAFIYITNLGRYLPIEQGAWNQVWASTTPKTNVVNGEYYEPVGRPGARTKASNDGKLAHELWEWTEEQLQDYKL
jgi:NAD(P)-dependent dehydrogenase (short-subunit alcohol dehydrogenase family)